jgi:hypothetical protein
VIEVKRIHVDMTLGARGRRWLRLDLHVASLITMIVVVLALGGLAKGRKDWLRRLL